MGAIYSFLIIIKRTCKSVFVYKRYIPYDKIQVTSNTDLGSGMIMSLDIVLPKALVCLLCAVTV